MIEIKVLSVQEEYNFLKDFWRILKEDAENFRCEGKYACGEYYLGHGSSRMAFVLPEDLVKTYFSDWNLPLDKSYVVKINMGAGGFVQSKNEILAYRIYGDRYPLAAIYAYGQYVEIMENVNNILSERECYIDCDEIENGYNAYYTYYYNMQKDICNLAFKLWGDGEDIKNWLSYDKPDMSEDACEAKLKELIAAAKKDSNHVTRAEGEVMEDNIRILKAYSEAKCKLDDILGETADNSQLGINDEGDVVTYDYGFRGNEYESGWSYSHSWSSPIANEMDSIKNRVDYIAFLTGILKDSPRFNGALSARKFEIQYCQTKDIDYHYIREENLDENGMFCQKTENIVDKTKKNDYNIIVKRKKKTKFVCLTSLTLWVGRS